MANQKRHWNWKDDDSTFNLSSSLVGILPPGRYRGFDCTLDNTMVLKLTHQTTGHELVLENGSLDVPRGVIISNQGVIVTEDDSEELPIAIGHATLDRIDLVVLQHEYVQVVGGTIATYSIIQGLTSTNPIKPVLNLPLKQVVIGILYVPAGTTTLTDAGVVYTPEEIPFIGKREKVALLDHVNRFEDQVQENFDITTIPIEADFTAILDEGSNTYNIGMNETKLVGLPTRPIGTKIYLRFKQAPGNTVQLGASGGSTPLGFSRILLESTTIDILIVENLTTVGLIMTNSGWEIVFYSGQINDFFDLALDVIDNENRLDLIDSVWTNYNLNGLRINDSNNGTGSSDTLFGIGIGSYIKYKIIGKTAFINFNLVGLSCKGANVINAASIIVNNLPSTLKPKSIISASCIAIVSASVDGPGAIPIGKHGYMSGYCEVVLNPNNVNLMTFRLPIHSGVYASFNRKYSLATLPYLILTATADTQSLPSWDISGTISYELD